MARKPTLNIESLSALGLSKLAQLVLDEAARNAAFRKLANAALAGARGPEAVAKLVDRRLAALEKARGFIDWEKIRAFRDDLRATVGTIAQELAQGSAAMAVDRLLRFIATYDAVFDRIDDSSGHIQGVYHEAIAALGRIGGGLAKAEADRLPEQIMAALGADTHDYLRSVTGALVPHIPSEALARWDHDLVLLLRKAGPAGKGGSYRSADYVRWRLNEVRQVIARARDDLDLLIEIEEAKHPNMQDTIGIAESLQKAGRLDEALRWIRKKPSRALLHMSAETLDDGEDAVDPWAVRSTSMEAAILTAMGDSEAAQKLRWTAFEQSLNPMLLREYVGALPDFEEFGVLDRAFAHASQSPHCYHALSFFMEWPRIDLAAALVVRHHGAWDGSRYYILPAIAQALEHDHPLAASVLYRALIDDILERARSKAYTHAVKYLGRLSALEPDLDRNPDNGIVTHRAYVESLRKAHGRKTGFWSLIKAA